MSARLSAADLDSFVGRCGTTVSAPQPVNATMIEQWCQVFGNDNRVYQDAGFAGLSRFGEVIAPAAMTQVWMMAPYGESPPADAVSELYELLDRYGYTGIVATNSQQSYRRPIHLGDRLSSTRRIAAISDEKSTRLGVGRFVTNEFEVVDETGELVASQMTRHFKFRPPGSTASPTAPPSAARRPRPVATKDSEFFFTGARRNALLIQQCDECGSLQHPPWPACSTCHSLSLHPAEMSGGGELYSYTVMHAPVVAPFKPPYLVALVALDEGPRIVAGLLGVRPEEAKIGMRLQVEFARFDEDLTLPVFRPATSRDDLDPQHANGTKRAFKTISPSEVRVGGLLPELTLPITHTFITAGALATRDFQPVHHSTSYAKARGLPDVITNIWSTQAVVSRFVTDWTGPEAMITDVDLRLGDSNYPGDILTLSGFVRDVDPDDHATGSTVTVEFVGANNHGIHVSGTVSVSLLESPSASLAASEAEER